MTSNYFAADNGVTAGSRRFSAAIGSFYNNQVGNYRNINLIHEAEIKLGFLLPLSAGLD